MADQPIRIDDASLFDDTDARRVEFAAEVDGERRDFAVLYDAIEALDGPVTDRGAVAAFARHRDAIGAAALTALGRDADAERVVVSENDLA